MAISPQTTTLRWVVYLSIATSSPHSPETQFIFSRSQSQASQRSLPRPGSKFNSSLLRRNVDRATPDQKTLIQDCSNGSEFSLLMQIETVTDTFHKLSTLLDIFLVQKHDLNNHVRELVILVRKQCSQSKSLVGKDESELRNEVVSVFEQLKNDIVPDKANLASIFDIEALEEEIHNRSRRPWR